MSKGRQGPEADREDPCRGITRRPFKRIFRPALLAGRQINDQHLGLRELPPRGGPRLRGTKLMKPFSQKWMLSRDLGEPRAGLGAGAPRRSRRAGGLPHHLLQGSAVRTANVVPRALQVGCSVEKGGIDVRDSASNRVLGWERKVHARTRVYMLITHG